MNFVANQSQQEKAVPIIYRLHRWFFAASIVLGTAATCVMVATNPGYYNSQTGEAGLLAGYASANVAMVQIHLISKEHQPTPVLAEPRRPPQPSGM